MNEMKDQNHLTLHVIYLWGLRGLFLLSHLLGLSKDAPIALSVLSWEGLELGGPALKLHPSPEPSLLLGHFLRASPTSAPQVPIAQGGVTRSVKGR